MKARIEMHAIKDRGFKLPGIETRFYPEDLKEFLKWSALENPNRVIDRINFYLKSGRKIEFREHTVVGSIYIRPKENYVYTFTRTLHNVCQHAFDILPLDIRSSIYGADERIDEPWLICNLHVKDELFKVYNYDIGEGLNLELAECKKFDNSFVKWIKHRDKDRL